ncbi:hypothetical protein ACLOJK_019286, partial [Asimina triloba]
QPSTIFSTKHHPVTIHRPSRPNQLPTKSGHDRKQKHKFQMESLMATLQAANLMATLQAANAVHQQFR